MTSKECKNCGKLKSIEKFHKHKDMVDGRQTQCKECHKERRKVYLNSKEGRTKRDNKYKEWVDNNRQRKNAHNAQRRAQRLNATLEGVTCNVVYLLCPEGYVVDHVVPLQGKNVCGLHVPWNLQYLTPFENGSKGNKYEGHIS